MNKLINTIQHYNWGSKTALTELYGIENPTQQPMAELWMGAHPEASSMVCIDGEQVSLAEMINQNPRQMLGEEVAQRFAGLPYLFKVLCAAAPLSVQVHPDKGAAEQGYARENQAGIPLSSPLRNYKDNNHKPELIYALTPFRAMNGFRPPEQIAGLLSPLSDAHPQIPVFIARPDAEGLKQLFATLLSLQGDALDIALRRLSEVSADLPGEPWQTVRDLQNVYPGDQGQFMPLLLNVVRLQPGEAMFLFARTPHAYLHGSGLEIMANSNNVLRAGLTPKHIDIPELLANVAFVSCPAEALLTSPVYSRHEISFPVPVDDFSFVIYQLQPTAEALSCQGPRIVLCLEGAAVCVCSGQQLALQPGESLFIPANEPDLQVSGHGRLAVAYCEIH